MLDGAPAPAPADDEDRGARRVQARLDAGDTARDAAAHVAAALGVARRRAYAVAVRLRRALALAGQVPGGELGGDDVDHHAGALLEARPGS